MPSPSSSAARMAQMVETYFRGVDTRDLDLILSVLSEDCRFTVESHGDSVSGHAGIRAMFEHIWTSPGTVLHHDFVHTADVDAGRIASQFQVTYHLAEGQVVRKSNCNVCTLRGDRFARVQVYMAGANRLKAPPA
ncbi:MAG: nuclear transport factor 2 family protein [Alkalilacustris sp.]